MNHFLSSLTSLLEGFTTSGRAARAQQRADVRARAAAVTRHRLQEEEPFLHAIADAPDDDLPRLIFADWLEERGDPRAEFIRVQCELARLPADDAHRRSLATRERQLLRQHYRNWTGPLLMRVGHGLEYGEPTYERGFIEEIRITAEDFLAHAPALFARAPLQRVHLSTAGGYVPQLADCPYLARLTALAFSWDRIGGKRLRSLLASPYLARLKCLRLETCGIGDDGAEALAAAPALAGLTQLDLSTQEAPARPGNSSRMNQIGDAGASLLVQSPHLGRLESLDLRGNPIGAAGQTALRKRWGQRVQLS